MVGPLNTILYKLQSLFAVDADFGTIAKASLLDEELVQKVVGIVIVNQEYAFNFAHVYKIGMVK